MQIGGQFEFPIDIAHIYMTVWLKSSNASIPGTSPDVLEEASPSGQCRLAFGRLQFSTMICANHTSQFFTTRLFRAVGQMAPQVSTTNREAGPAINGFARVPVYSSKVCFSTAFVAFISRKSPSTESISESSSVTRLAVNHATLTAPGLCHKYQLQAVANRR
ncbi:MAG: hypothetical protein ACLQU4_19315 [Limisphaerales bacterium]